MAWLGLCNDFSEVNSCLVVFSEVRLVWLTGWARLESGRVCTFDFCQSVCDICKVLGMVVCDGDHGKAM
jgi:hypothetical protein